MASTTYSWISLWFLVTTPVIVWDASYCFLRPRSMAGGDLHWIWKPYEIYQDIDYIYGLPAFERGDGFTNAQSFMNIVETIMNVLYLYLAHVVEWPAASVVGFASVVMTLSKTVLYWLQEYFCGGCSVGHNSMRDLIVYWIIPNGFWLVVPSFIVYTFGRDLINATYASQRSTAKEVSGKKQ